jgi:NAD(P)-dependent dehydrogenase (short-subunit alcohol dehydrogenase family)
MEGAAIDLGNRIVLITGAVGAIGSATARTIVHAGGTVLLHDVRATFRGRTLRWQEVRRGHRTRGTLGADGR